MSPTQLTLAQLRKDGYTARVVEQTIHAGHRVFKRDCFGFDVLACKVGAVQSDPPPISYGWILGVQAGSDVGGHHADHRARLLASAEAAQWVAAGGKLEVWSWSTRRSLERTKAGKRSKRLVHHLRREEITLADFVPKPEPVNPADFLCAADDIGDDAAATLEPF